MSLWSSLRVLPATFWVTPHHCHTAHLNIPLQSRCLSNIWVFAPIVCWKFSAGLLDFHKALLFLVIVSVGGLKGKTEENSYFPMTIISHWSSFFLHEFLLSSSFCYSLWVHLSKRYKCKTVRWMNWEPVIDSEVSQKEKNKYINTHTHIYNLEKWYWWTYLQGRNGDTDVKNKVLSPDSNWTLSVKPIKII